MIWLKTAPHVTVVVHEACWRLIGRVIFNQQFWCTVLLTKINQLKSIKMQLKWLSYPTVARPMWQRTPHPFDSLNRSLGPNWKVPQMNAKRPTIWKLDYSWFSFSFFFYLIIPTKSAVKLIKLAFAFTGHQGTSVCSVGSVRMTTCILCGCADREWRVIRWNDVIGRNGWTCDL